MMHWGAYSQLGIVESWALSDADACWSRHCIDWEVTGEEFKKQYFDLNKTFNPIPVSYTHLNSHSLNRALFLLSG